MPVVRILIPTLYEPKPDDSPKCWGQLRVRPSVIQKTEVAADGKTTTTTLCGPMERYFPKDAKPELSDEMAAEYIAARVAEPVDEEPVRFVSTKEILKDIKVE